MRMESFLNKSSHRVRQSCNINNAKQLETIIRCKLCLHTNLKSSQSEKINPNFTVGFMNDLKKISLI